MSMFFPSAIVDDAAYIKEKICAVPKNPADTLLSRRKITYPYKIEARGDAIGFYLRTNTELVSIIRETQRELWGIFCNDLGISPPWPEDKQKRHELKPFKWQKTLHLAFLSSCPPCSEREYTKIAAANKTQTSALEGKTPEQVASEVLQRYIDTHPWGTIKECKLNPDGHVVVRVSVTPASNLLKCKEELQHAFGKVYVRHPDPEKETTLAAVIFVANYNYPKLSQMARDQINATIKVLQEKLQGKVIPLEELFWVKEYRCRTLSPNSISEEQCYHFSPSEGLGASFFGNFSSQIPQVFPVPAVASELSTEMANNPSAVLAEQTVPRNSLGLR